MIPILLCISLFWQMTIPITAFAETTEKKTVRVGWHEPPYFIMDDDGRKSGYSYEYQRKLAAYTGWEYEYVQGTWSDLMQLLKKGEIDLMSDVSYSPERAKEMLFSSIPMGTESYYIFVSPDNQEISSENISALNGKRVGVTKGSIQEEYFQDWAEKHDIHADVIELNDTEEESMKLMGSQIDAYVTIDVYGSPETAVPLCKIASSDFFFVVNQNRPDLLTDLDTALNKIQDKNKYYDQELHDKYLKNTETNKYLNSQERKWLNDHGVIRVGYQDNYLAFCAQDPETGTLTGALKNYLELAASAFENAKLEFQSISYPTAAEALSALKKGDIDCVFPANLTDYDAEQLDFVISPPLMQSEMEAVVPESKKKEFLQKETVTVAVNEGNTNYEVFLADQFPKWKRMYFPDTPAGLEAVSSGNADCLIISNYRYNNISKQCEKLHLTTIYTGVDMDYCFALREGDTELYSVLSAINSIIPGAAIHSALTYYSTEDVKTSFTEIIKENLFIVMSVISGILLVIIILLLRIIYVRKKVAEREHQVKDLNRRVFVDALTSVRNKGAYEEYIKDLQKRIDQKEQPEFAIGIFDCNNLKYINDNHGHDKGDIYLKSACQLICKVFEHSPVFRIGGDEFAVILQNQDYLHREELIRLFEIKRKEICDRANNKWEEVHIAIGVTIYDPQMDHSVSDTVRRADSMMYENKRKEKGG